MTMPFVSAAASTDLSVAQGGALPAMSCTIAVTVDGQPDIVRISPMPASRTAMARVVQACFDAFPQAARLSISAAGTAPDDRHVQRSEFYQEPHWYPAPRADRMALPLVALPDGRHAPQRPPAPDGLFYDRHDPRISATLTLRAIDPSRDLDLFHGWMNQVRVAFYWDLAQSKEELGLYLERLAADPHAFGAIGSLDGEPSTYFEIYWAKEDRLGSHYDAEDYDRGWHALVGERRHLGRARTTAWFRAITHCLFLDDRRTGRIVGEPRADHLKMLAHGIASGYVKEKEFDFPHKRSALMVCPRASFFRDIQL